MKYNTNPVEEYFIENPNMKLSVTSLSKKLDLTKRQIVYLVNNSEHVRRIDPMEVGSGKSTLSVYAKK